MYDRLSELSLSIGRDQNGLAWRESMEGANWGLHPLIHTYEKAGCQVKKLYQLPSLALHIGLIAKHLSVITQRCHTIMYLINGVPITFSASPYVGHVN